ncbi:MAG: metallophosphoesterase family protein [Thermoproteota archaeon]
MKIGVFSDTHIGRRTPAEIGDLRKHAYRHAFTQAINIFIEEGIDCLIHAGDLFEKRSMSSDDSVFVKEELQRLVSSVRKKHHKEVVIFMIRGNHDGFLENNALDFVKHPLAKYFKTVGEKLSEGEEESYTFVEIMLMGLPYHPYISKVFKEAKPLIQKVFEESSYIKIFVTHNFIGGHHDVPPGTPHHSCLTVSDLQDIDVDIVIAGHHHVRKGPEKHGETMFLTPGATEAFDLSDKGPFGVYVLEPGAKPRFIPIEPLHEIQSMKIDSGGAVKPGEWFVEKALGEAKSFASYLKTKGADGILRLVITGRSDEDQSKIDSRLRNELVKLTGPKGLLHVDLENRVEEISRPLELPKLGAGMEYIEAILKPLGSLVGEAMNLVEEVDRILDEKASRKTGLLIESERSRFVKRWIDILNKVDTG